MLRYFRVPFRLLLAMLGCLRWPRLLVRLAHRT